MLAFRQNFKVAEHIVQGVMVLMMQFAASRMCTALGQPPDDMSAMGISIGIGTRAVWPVNPESATSVDVPVVPIGEGPRLTCALVSALMVAGFVHPINTITYAVGVVKCA